MHLECLRRNDGILWLQLRLLLLLLLLLLHLVSPLLMPLLWLLLWLWLLLLCSVALLLLLACPCPVQLLWMDPPDVFLQVGLAFGRQVAVRATDELAQVNFPEMW